MLERFQSKTTLYNSATKMYKQYNMRLRLSPSGGSDVIFSRILSLSQSGRLTLSLTCRSSVCNVCCMPLFLLKNRNCNHSWTFGLARTQRHQRLSVEHWGTSRPNRKYVTDNHHALIPKQRTLLFRFLVFMHFLY